MIERRYWREGGRRRYCCFARNRLQLIPPGMHVPPRYVSLCQRRGLGRGELGSQDLNRPPILWRCARCEVVEMELLGLAQSAPTSDSFKVTG